MHITTALKIRHVSLFSLDTKVSIKFWGWETGHAVYNLQAALIVFYELVALCNNKALLTMLQNQIQSASLIITGAWSITFNVIMYLCTIYTFGYKQHLTKEKHNMIRQL